MEDSKQFGLYYRDRDPITGEVRIHETHLDRANYFYDKDKPILLMVPGYTINRDKPAATVETQVSGYIKTVENILVRGDTKTKPNILCAVFSREGTEEHRNQYGVDKQHNLTGSSPSDEEQFLKQVLLPIAGLHNGAHPSADEICEHFSRVTMAGHSSGCRFIQEVGRLLRCILRERGYNNEEIERIIREPVMIGLGNTVPLEQDGVSFRTINFSPQCDRRIWWGNMKQGITDPVEAREAARRSYAAIGFDPDVLESRLERLDSEPYWPRTTHFVTKEHTNGISFFTDLPNRLRWDDNGVERTETSQSVEHAVTSFIYYGKTEPGQISNHHMVDKVSATVINAIGRERSDPAHWREELKAMATILPVTMQPKIGITT
ncbi:MAG: hypothetical protein J0M34_08660 [Alphaproteobacteria bacterium]|nr:hypothetical protein [Alphaproteobacteria bacterium]